VDILEHDFISDYGLKRVDDIALLRRMNFPQTS